MSFGPRTIEEARNYRYGVWGGNPNGRKYDPARCMESVSSNDRLSIPHQCGRNVWKDGFCKQHHPDTIKANREAREQKYQEEREQGRKKWAMQSAAPDMLAALDELYNAMRRYEADVDTEAPHEHHQMMCRARAAIAKAKGEA